MGFGINPFSGELVFRENLWNESGVTISPANSGRSLSLGIGASVGEFSTDGTLSGNDDNVVPVESSVKTYVDGKEIATSVSYEDTETTIEFGPGNYGKRNQIDNSNAVGITLPSISASDIGKHVEIVKLGAGNLTITAADSDTILTSPGGGNISNSVAGEIGAFIKLVVDTETKWNVMGIYGTWIVSS